MVIASHMMDVLTVRWILDGLVQVVAQQLQVFVSSAGMENVKLVNSVMMEIMSQMMAALVVP